MLNHLNRYGKNSAWAVAVLSMLLMGTGCSSKDTPADTSPTASVTASASASASASPSADPSPTVSASAAPTEAADAEKESTGVYDGQIDPHSVEIKSAEGTNAYQVDDAIAGKIADWDENTKVKFKYKKDGEQLILTSIDKQ